MINYPIWCMLVLMPVDQNLWCCAPILCTHIFLLSILHKNFSNMFFWCSRKILLFMTAPQLHGKRSGNIWLLMKRPIQCFKAECNEHYSKRVDSLSRLLQYPLIQYNETFKACDKRKIPDGSWELCVLGTVHGAVALLWLPSFFLGFV